MASTKHKLKYRKWDIVLADLDPTRGSEIAKTRPCLVVSPNAMNQHLATLIIAPFTSAQKRYPMRVATQHKGMQGELCLDQLKTIFKERVVRREGVLEEALRPVVNAALQQMFSEP